jgi:MFS family permease
MHGARVIATNMFLHAQPRHHALSRDAYIPKYPAPHAEAGKQPAAQALRRGASIDNEAWTVITAALIGLIASFSLHLVNLRMQNLGIAGSLISLSVAIQALAICISALLAKRVIANRGLQYTLPASAVVSALALLAVFLTTDIVVINLLRILYAAGVSFLLITSEYLVTARSNHSRRWQLVAWYTTALGAGAVLGPLLVSIMGVRDSAPFIVGAALLLFGAGALSTCLSDHEGKAARTSSPFAALLFMPAAFVAAFVFGMADNGGLSMLPVYGALNGYDQARAANLAVFAALGAAMLQFPIGWLATKRNTVELMVVFGVLSICLVAVLPIVIGNELWACIVSIGLGAFIEGLYTIGLISISRDRRIQSFSSMNACFISVCSLGEVAGPIATGISMQYLGANGLVLTLLVVFAVYVLGMVNRLRPTRRHPLTFN